jgi:hypothetical protein
VILARVGRPRDDSCKEWPQLVVASTDAFAAVDVGYHWAFQRCARRVAGEQTLQIVRGQSVFPSVRDSLDVRRRGRGFRSIVEWYGVHDLKSAAVLLRSGSNRSAGLLAVSHQVQLISLD